MEWKGADRARGRRSNPRLCFFAQRAPCRGIMQCCSAGRDAACHRSRAHPAPPHPPGLQTCTRGAQRTQQARPRPAKATTGSCRRGSRCGCWAGGVGGAQVIAAVCKLRGWTGSTRGPSFLRTTCLPTCLLPSPPSRLVRVCLLPCLLPGRRNRAEAQGLDRTSDGAPLQVSRPPPRLSRLPAGRRRGRAARSAAAS